MGSWLVVEGCQFRCWPNGITRSIFFSSRAACSNGRVLKPNRALPSTFEMVSHSISSSHSRFSFRALQITDSFYVAHSEDLLYRSGYEEFIRSENKDDFFYFWHSAGQLDERNTTLNVDKRRIYIDPIENRVLSVNNQYAQDPR